MVEINLMDLQARIEAAADRIAPYVRRTPLEFSHGLSEKNEGNVFIKMESEQRTGSFKVRGAFNKCLVLRSEQPDVHVTTASSGNHALACTLAMKTVGLTGTIYLSENVSKTKELALVREGAILRHHGTDAVEAETKARQTAQEEGIPFISPYNDMEVMTGQGTVGKEILEDLPDVDAVFVPVGGGGLIAGIAAYIKAVKPTVKVVGCQPAHSAVMAKSVEAGRILDLPSLDTLSDGTAGGVEEGSITFPICQQCVDDWVLVEEDVISDAIYFMMADHHKIVEGAAGVAIGAFLQTAQKYHGKSVAIISCGANISIEKLKKIIECRHP
ncbi:L-threonine ammonia-lyase-like isoform X2 [Branchiostoma floridae x Branchiostoma japonicum]